MIHLATFVKIVPFSQYTSYDGTDITADVDVLTLMSGCDIKFEEKPDTSDAGTKYKQSFKIVSEKLSDTIRTMYPPNIPVVALIYTDDQQAYILGNEESKLRLTIQPTPNEDICSFYRETLTPLF
jgi:hypothetical protein